MDRKLYEKTFDQVRMSPLRTSQVRRELAARRAQIEMEDTNMTNHPKSRRPAAALIALCAVAALTVTAFASGGKTLERVFQMMTGFTVQQGTDENGSYYFEDSGEEQEPVSPVELRDDGRLYLTVNGENLDITGQCSYETPYIYECVGEDGLRHTFIIGGEPDSIGWVEYAAAEEDDTALSSTVLSVPDEAELQTLPWLQNGLEQAAGDTPTTFHFEFDEAGYPVIDGVSSPDSATVITITENQE